MDEPRYRSSAGLSAWFRRAMSVCMLASLAALVLRGIDMYLLDDLRAGQVASEAYLGLTEIVWTVLNVSYTAALLCGAVTLSWWVARTVRNTEALAHGRIRSAWWHWVWFWIPPVCLVRPIGVVSELWVINRMGLGRVKDGYSGRRRRGERVPGLDEKPGLVVAWWSLVLAWVIVERVSEAVLVYGDVSSIGLPSNWGVYAAMGGNALGVLAGLSGIEVVRRVTAMQSEWDERTPKSESTTGRRGRALQVSPLRSGDAA